jgi:arylsulfatase A-like enzyme
VEAVAPRIPDGWTDFVAHVATAKMPETGWSDFYVLTGRRAPGVSVGTYEHVAEYSPEYSQRRALSFLERVGDAPFFLYVATRAPHVPATPAARDADAFPDFAYQGRGFGEEDLSDKPDWVRFEAEAFQTWLGQRGDLPRKSLQSLQAVDRLVGAVVDDVARRGLLDDTVFFFTSDSGFQWLEHRISNKGAQYEESLLVPFVAYFPGARPRQDDHLIAVNLDIGATIFDLIGSAHGTDGVSLLPHLGDRPHAARNEVFFEVFPGYEEPGLKRRYQRPFPARFFAELRISEESSE